jgi:hypothetical protein
VRLTLRSCIKAERVEEAMSVTRVHETERVDEVTSLTHILTIYGDGEET